jgi:hypothetical protein
MRMNSETRSELFFTASRMLCEVATLLEHCSAPDSDAEPTQEPGYSIEVLDAEETLNKIARGDGYSRADTLNVIHSVFCAGREEASEEMFARGYAAGRCEMEAAKTTLGGGRAPGEEVVAELIRQKEELDLALHAERKQAAAQKLAALVVMRDGVPVEDQAAGIAEFKERYGYFDKTHVAEKRAGNLARSQAAADLAGDNVRPMNPAFRYRGEYRDRAPTAEYPGD